MNFSTMTLSYFICEQHSVNFEQIIHLAEKLGFSVRVYESKDSNQFDFMQSVYRDTAIIVDATIPNDLTLSTVYPLLTAHVNILDHILVFSEKQYEDGAEVLPLNITPKRTRNKNEDLLEWLEKQLVELKDESLFDRFVIESPDVVVNYMKRMEEAIVKSIEKYEQKRGGKTRVMISYRNSCGEEVERFRKEEEAKGMVEIKVLPPGSLCGDYEAHTPMRRWMLAGLLDDHIREVDEVWVYYNDTYTNSWWTLAELVMVANINKDRSDDKKVKIKVYDVKEKRFLEEKDYPSFVDVKLTDEQHRRLARLLSNTRPDTMGPENLDNMVQLRQVVPILRIMTDEMREAFIDNIRPMLEMGIPQTLPDDQRELMLQDMLKLYSDPDELERYVNDEVFQDVFWNNISYQTAPKTPAMMNDLVNIDVFMDTPMNENTGLSEVDLEEAAQRGTSITLNSSAGTRTYRVEKGIKRYLWLATRMGQPTVKDAPGIEVIQTYNMVAE